MNPEIQPAAEHPRFDSLCQGLGEYEALPSPQTAADAQAPEEQPDEALDGQILAALVSPY